MGTITDENKWAQELEGTDWAYEHGYDDDDEVEWRVTCGDLVAMLGSEADDDDAHYMARLLTRAGYPTAVVVTDNNDLGHYIPQAVWDECLSRL